MSEEENFIDSEFESRENMKFPTDLEIAKQGVSTLKKVLDQLPTKLQQNIIEWKYIPCFLGIEPWIFTAKHYQLTEVEQAEIDLAIKSAPNFLVVLYTEPRRNGSEEIMRSIFNLSAVQKVIKNHPQFFPSEAQNNPREWLTRWVKSRQDVDLDKQDEKSKEERRRIINTKITRAGLLSGYPIWAVEKFVQEKLATKQKNTLSQNIPEFIDKKSTVLNYVSYPEYQQLDNDYIAKIEEIRKNSGIEESVRLYKTNAPSPEWLTPPERSRENELLEDYED